MQKRTGRYLKEIAATHTPYVIDIVTGVIICGIRNISPETSLQLAELARGWVVEKAREPPEAEPARALLAPEQPPGTGEGRRRGVGEAVDEEPRDAPDLGQGRGGGLVDDAQDLEARDLPGLLGGGPLGVVEVGRDGDDRPRQRLAQMGLRGLLQLAQHHGRDLRRRVLAAAHLHAGGHRHAELAHDRHVGVLDLRVEALADLDPAAVGEEATRTCAESQNPKEIEEGQRAAQQVCEQHDGRFPEHIEAVMQLPGVGRSTAGAILSLACGQRHAILDGNVKRVLARFHAVEGWPGKTAVLEQLWALAEAATPQRDVAAYNQAMMDLGATLCRRGTPECPRCPLQSDCRACQRGRQSEFPAPRPRRDLPTRNVHMLLLSGSDGAVYLERRPASGIWGGLWSFPEFDTEAALLDWCDQRNIPLPERLETWQALRHTFSHFHLDITPCRLRLKNPGFSVMEGGGAVWYNTGQSAALGLAAPVQRLLAQLQNST